MPRHYTDKELYERGLLVPSCGNCRHHDGWHRCAAFPQGIPHVILNGTVAHIEPLPNDNGVQYEPRDEQRSESRWCKT